MPEICSRFLTMLSARCNTSVVLAKEAPGGIDIEKVTKLSSSVGIKLDGVLFIRKIPAAESKANRARVSHFLRSRKFKERIYLLVSVSNATLNPSKNRLEYLDNLLPFNSFSLSSWWLFLNNKAHSAGLNVNALSAEIKIAVASV